jgi:hypothetical protein
MNEVEELSKLDIRSLPPLRSMALDDLHFKAFKNLHLELGTGPILYLLSPSYSVLHPTANETITDFATKKVALLDYLREYIAQNLAVYSVLLDVNSYFIEQNSFVVLARLREQDSGGRRFEIKFYTNSPLDLTAHYEDKIYIGRDFVDLFNFKRKHFGVKELVVSVKDQNEKMIDKAQEKLRSPLEYKSFFQEITELVSELSSESLLILQSLPSHIDYGKISEKDLIDINAQYRAIKHYVIELHDEVEEFENVLHFHKENDFARYVTKYKKDVTNLISYFNIKINGSLTQRIYEFKNREK